MIFLVGVAFWFSLFMPAAMLDHLKGTIFQNYLRDYVNEYGHFEVINKEERSMNMIVQIS